jgi:hypothetical protein
MTAFQPWTTSRWSFPDPYRASSSTLFDTYKETTADATKLTLGLVGGLIGGGVLITIITCLGVWYKLDKRKRRQQAITMEPWVIDHDYVLAPESTPGRQAVNIAQYPRVEPYTVTQSTWSSIGNDHRPASGHNAPSHGQANQQPSTGFDGQDRGIEMTMRDRRYRVWSGSSHVI